MSQASWVTSVYQPKLEVIHQRWKKIKDCNWPTCKLLQQSDGRRTVLKVNWNSQHVAIPHVNNDNERPGTLREGVSWEMDCNRNGSNATICVFSSDTECMMCGSVFSVYHGTICVSASACQLSKLTTMESGVARLQQTHTRCLQTLRTTQCLQTLHTDPLLYRNMSIYCNTLGAI